MAETAPRASFLHRWLLGWIPFLGCSALIIRGAVMPPQEIPVMFLRMNDKVVHAAEFFILFCAGVNALRHAAEPFGSRANLTSFLYSLALGVLTEFLQLAVPQRSADWRDFLADAAGASAAYFLLLCLRRPAGRRA